MRYTAVFEFGGKTPVQVKASDGWLGGTLVQVQFSDALEEIQRLRTALETVASGIANGHVKSKPLMLPFDENATSIGMTTLGEIVEKALAPQ
jgi:hypothetical protein